MHRLVSRLGEKKEGKQRPTREIENRGKQQCPRYVIFRYLVPFPFESIRSSLTSFHTFLLPLPFVHALYGHSQFLVRVFAKPPLLFLSSNISNYARPTTLSHNPPRLRLVHLRLSNPLARLAPSGVPRSHRPNSSGNTNSSSSAAAASANPR